MAGVARSVAWVKDDPLGLEFAEIEIGAERVHADGVAIGTQPVPYRLDYTLEAAAGFRAQRLHVNVRGGGWRRSLDLTRGVDGPWTVTVDEAGEVDLPRPGGDPAALTEASDCDLGLCPVTNLIPILRHGLGSGGSVELTAAWVSVPDLAVQPDGQRYTFVSGDGDATLIRFDALDGTFASVLTVDADGIAVEYPGIARRL
jgi:hypothetical protein